MRLSEVVLKVKHDCPFSNISKLPDVRVFMWCNRQHEVTEIVTSNSQQSATVMEKLEEIPGHIEKFAEQNKIHLVANCLCTADNSIARIVDEFNLLHIQPIIHERGFEYHRLIVFKHEELKKLLERLEEKNLKAEVLRKIPFDGLIASSLTLTAGALSSGLTGKQIGALLAAYKRGYYVLPRKTDLKTIAAKEHVPRTTFEEHLKKAENKLMAKIVPYLQILSQPADEG